MKNILIATYILIVLLISAFAKAETLTVSSVQFRQDRNLLKISGTYFGVCLNKIRPSLEEVTTFKKDEVAVRLQLLQQGPCAAQYKKVPFEMALDTRTLGLPVGEAIEVHIDNLQAKSGPIELTTDQAIDFDYANLQSYTGVISQLGEKNFILNLENNNVVKLSGPFDYAKYVGRLVSVRGFEMGYNVQPIRMTDGDAANIARVMVMNIFDLDLN